MRLLILFILVASLGCQRVKRGERNGNNAKKVANGMNMEQVRRITGHPDTIVKYPVVDQNVFRLLNIGEIGSFEYITFIISELDSSVAYIQNVPKR